MRAKPKQRSGLIVVCLVMISLITLIAGCASPFGQSPTPLGPVSATPSSGPSATLVSPATPAPAATPSVLPTATPSPSPTPVPNIVQVYQWVYKGKLYQFPLSIPQPAADHYRGLPHSAGSDYSTYAVTALDRPYLPSIILKEAVQSEGFGEYDAVMLVQSFVLSLQNTPGRDNSPKYPVETLLDRGGDSEDTSLLAASLLNDMGYDAVLLGFPGHMAVGVKGAGELYGRYFRYHGADYYYLETAIPGYEFGAAPEEYRNVSATIYPMIGGTTVVVNATVEQTSEEALYVHYRVRCDVRNTGPGTAKNVSVYCASLALIYGPDQTWSSQEVPAGDIETGGSRSVEATLRIPRSGDTRVECIVTGDNFDPVVWNGEQFTL